jgi:hypothetical protein
MGFVLFLLDYGRGLRFPTNDFMVMIMNRYSTLSYTELSGALTVVEIDE